LILGYQRIASNRELQHSLTRLLGRMQHLLCQWLVPFACHSCIGSFGNIEWWIEDTAWNILLDKRMERCDRVLCIALAEILEPEHSVVVLFISRRAMVGAALGNTRDIPNYSCFDWKWHKRNQSADRTESNRVVLWLAHTMRYLLSAQPIDHLGTLGIACSNEPLDKLWPVSNTNAHHNRWLSEAHYCCNGSRDYSIPSI
jgi:hypothetical protein